MMNSPSPKALSSTHLSEQEIRLTALCHGGGCGCKISPSVLSSLLEQSPLKRLVPQSLLVGAESADDAAVYQLNDEQALVLTTDFFLPVVDNPSDFGRIAATNALSDVYAMGGQPIMALAIVGMPINTLPIDIIRAILQGGESVCLEAGIPIAGGHSIDVAEPFYGLVVAGLVSLKNLRRNTNAQIKDRLMLFKPLGVGIYSAALRQQKLSDKDYQDLINLTTQRNTLGITLGQQKSVHALTDVTGFGLLGHLLEICRGSQVSVQLQWSSIPWLPQAQTFVQQGLITGASKRNLQSFANHIQWQGSYEPWHSAMLCDPQTSGGLLASVNSNDVAHIWHLAHQEGFIAATIGTIIAPNSHNTKDPFGIIVDFERKH